MRFRLLPILILCLAGFGLPASGAENVLNLTNTVIEPGSTGKVTVSLANATECRGLQASITLPEGLSLTGVASTDRTSASMVTCNTKPGQEKLIIVSMGTPFTGISGSVCELELSAASSFSGGVVKLSNVRMSDGGDRSITLGDASAQVWATEPSVSTGNRLSISGSAIAPGATGSLLINLSNTSQCFGFQTDIELPEGLSLVEAKGTSRTASCMVTTNVRTGQEKVIVVAMGQPIPGNDGSVCELIVKASSSFKGGTVRLSNGKFSAGGDQSLLLAPASAYISSAGEMKVALPAFEIVAGEKKNVSVELDNSGDVGGLQLDLYLPEALSIDLASLATTARTAGFTINHLQRDGFVRLMLYSSGSNAVTGESGSVLTFDVTASEDFSGETVINLKNIRISNTHAVSLTAPDSQTKVTVTKPRVSAITLTPENSSLKGGETLQFSATVFPENVADKSVKWSVADPAIATTDETGLLTALSVGTTVLTATSNDNPEVKATAIITVTPTPAASISLNKTEATLKATETVELTATILPATTTDKSVTWKSSDESVATVDENGKVTAIAVGNATITATAASGVSATCEVTVIETPAASISLNKTEATLKATETVELTATILPDTTTDKSVTWKSSDESVATVDENGKVTAIAVGKVTITATAASGISATCEVTVIETSAASISLNKTEATLKATETVELTATILPDTTTDKSVTWKSSDESVATVDENGKVTAIAVGKATITATAASGINATCEVTVIETPAEKVVIDFSSMGIDGNNLEMRVGDVKGIKVTVTPETATDKTVTYQSANPGIATVDTEGNVTAIEVGETAITITAKSGVTATLNVKVLTTAAASISLNKTEATLKATETLELTATILPATTTDKSVTWKSSDESVATVDENGKVTAIAVGNATITATAASGISATCEVTVIETSAASISLNKTEATLKATETVELTATILPATTTDKSVTWKSSDESVATVDENGKVTAIAVGKATITATTASGISATCEVTVIETPAEKVVIDFSAMGIDGNDLEMRVGEVKGIKVTITPETATDKTVTYQSANPAIATVDAEGNVTAIEVGETTIIITAKSGVTATLNVKVLSTPAASISLNKTEATLKATETVELIATILPATTTDKSVTWKSSDESVATVDENGKVTAIAVGNATITATAASGISATCEVTVIETPAASISLNKTEATLKATETVELTATILPATTTDKSVTWKSSDESVATVDENGKVTAIAVGKATITATAASGISATCIATVVAREMEPIVLTHGPETINLLPSQKTTLWVKVLGGYPDGYCFDWSANGLSLSDTETLEVIGESVNHKSIDEYTLHVTNSGDGVTLLDETLTFTVITWPTPETELTVSGSHEKIREGNLYTMTAEMPAGGHEDGWNFAWHHSDIQLSTELQHSFETAMYEGDAKAIESHEFRFSAVNTSPEGNTWAELHAAPLRLDVYRAPQTPRQLVCKGNGSSKVMIALMTIEDSQLSDHGYRFVFGHTGPNGDDHIVEKGGKRYARYDAGIYDDASIAKWCYTEWTYDDGAIVTSRRRYVDGYVDEFDGSVFDGQVREDLPDRKLASDWIQTRGGEVRIEVDAVTDTRVAVYSLNGELMYSDCVSARSYRVIPVSNLGLNHGIYILRVESENGCAVQKINIK